MKYRTGVPIPLPEPDSGAYPDGELGEVLYGFEGTPNHLTVDLFKVPEGLVLRCICRRCGGRRERLVEYGTRVPDGARKGDTALENLLEGEVVPDVRTWTGEHKACKEKPWSYELPRKLVEFTGDVYDRTRQYLVELETVPAQVYMLMSEGEGMILPLLEVPDQGEDQQAHVTALERRKYAVRQYLRQEGIDLLASNLVREVDAGQTDGEPEAGNSGPWAVRFLQLMPPFSRAGRALVHRDPDSGPKQPPVLRSIEWASHVDPHPMLDGLFALGGGWSKERVRKARLYR